MTENGVSYVWLLEDKKGTITAAAEQLSLFRPKSTNTITDIWKPLLPLVITWVMSDGSATAAETLTKETTQRQPDTITKAITIREATCKQGGLKLNLCDKCGNFMRKPLQSANTNTRLKKYNPLAEM